jgi:voltage-gated potassium channel
MQGRENLPKQRERFMDSRARYGFGLALLLSAYVLDSFDGRLIQFLVDLTYIALLCVLILDPRAARWSRVLGITLIALSAISSVIYLASNPPDPVIGPISTSLNALVVALAVVVVTRRIATHKKVTQSTVMGAILAYALLGFVFASVYQTVALLNTDAFFNQGPVPTSDYSYFSFVTLTTLGYGDLTPALEVGKRLVVIEALLGQVVLVVFVARLVSLWGTNRALPDVSRDSPGD